MRKCSNCGNELTSKDSLCRECRREYQNNRSKKLRLWAIYSRGCKCSRCEHTAEELKHFFHIMEDEDWLAIFEFHHQVKETSWSMVKNINGINTQTSSSNEKNKQLNQWMKQGKVPDDVDMVCAICHAIIT